MQWQKEYNVHDTLNDIIDFMFATLVWKSSITNW